MKTLQQPIRQAIPVNIILFTNTEGRPGENLKVGRDKRKDRGWIGHKGSGECRDQNQEAITMTERKGGLREGRLFHPYNRDNNNNNNESLYSAPSA